MSFRFFPPVALQTLSRSSAELLSVEYNFFLINFYFNLYLKNLSVFQLLISLKKLLSLIAFLLLKHSYSKKYAYFCKHVIGKVPESLHNMFSVFRTYKNLYIDFGNSFKNYFMLKFILICNFFEYNKLFNKTAFKLLKFFMNLVKKKPFIFLYDI